MRERSYSCKSQWNTDSRMIRGGSENDPRMIRPHPRPSRTRRTAEVDHRGSGTDFVWKNIGFRASAISQKRISCETSSKFTMRERSYSCKSQWNTDSRMIRGGSENDPRMIRPHPRPSRTRRTAEVDHRGSKTDFVWKNIGFRASAISQKRISCETSSKFTMWERSYSCKSQWNTDSRMIRGGSENDPRMIRPHPRPSRTRRTAEVDHRGSGTDFVWKNIGFRASAISQKRISCETSSKFTMRERSYSCKSLTLFPWLTLSLTTSFFDYLFLWLTLSLTNSFFD